MTMTEPLPQAVLPEHLTDALRRSGVLGVNTCVSEATVESSRATILSRIIRLRLRYDGLSENAPPTVILKTGLPERAGGGWNAGRQEVAFYQQVAGAVAPPATPRCFEAHWNPKSEAWHLLLEDLTDTHLIATAWPLPPTVTQCQRIIEARARFQAVLWDDQRLGKSLGKWLDTEGYLQRFADAFTRFADRFGEQVPAERRRIYEQLLAAAPHLFSRYLSRRHLTIVQGDAHVWNCFLARDDSADIRFFDWDTWRINIGAADLSYMMAMHWYPERRARLEKTLLDRYHDALIAGGVRDYHRATLDDDYRLSVLWQITTPVWQAIFNIPPVIWWNNLERVFLAVDDLKCRDLLVA